jgi:hypothetical protein
MKKIVSRSYSKNTLAERQSPGGFWIVFAVMRYEKLGRDEEMAIQGRECNECL